MSSQGNTSDQLTLKWCFMGLNNNDKHIKLTVICVPMYIPIDPDRKQGHNVACILNKCQYLHLKEKKPQTKAKLWNRLSALNLGGSENRVQLLASAKGMES